ncbi:MAG: tRNA (adenosine(37)-N6)-threonylcarbamoyltransferase complex ATPase subunit type 1 TsaE [Myxococcota bacterium]|jgi:tRNA threonylcarbamoyladenosine biosynthesis protein TsaE|nr:tRNA (adenosine(37)-N6)-threonylcarbamoyltransferase complex ATPase subunit type 1 TsaE [Myxococcota bacterium]
MDRTREADEARPCFFSPSPESTLAWGERLGARLQPGSVLGLSAGLGVGKTQLVQGIARGYFEAPERVRVCSPSYTMINSYEQGHKRLHHIDLYRCASSDDLESIGYWDSLGDPLACCVIEWIRQVPDSLPSRFLELVLALEKPDEALTTPRLICLGEVRDQALHAALAPLFGVSS